MASEEAAQNVAQLTDEEKSTINEMMKVAQTLLNNSNIDNTERQLATLSGGIKNCQDRPILLSKTLDGFGSFVSDPSESIGGFDNGGFVHRAPSFNIPHLPGGGGGPGPVIIGCKAAVIYGTMDKALPQLGWLLAWFKPQNSNQNKVYVEAGLLEELMKKEWSEIDAKLNASGSVSRYVDSSTGAVAAAQIEDQPHNLALLGATFQI
ncbi:unnamed protein product [Amaranthus hypochondriacus]